MAFDLVIRNGLVVDGSGGPGFEADVAVEGERIAAIGKSLAAGQREIDAKGKVVSPGFIDPHTHMDLFLVLYPHGNPVVNFGVTTIVIGDCGASCAPVPDGEGPLKVLVAYLNRVLDNYIDASIWKWKTFPEYLNYLKGRVGVNVAALMPHSPVRLSVMGEAAYQRAATPEELQAMANVVREGLEAGAVGFSTSPRGGPEIHAGTPSTFAEMDELVTLGNLAGDYGGCFQFNSFNNLINPESLMPSLVERINARMIGNEFRLYPGHPEGGPRSLEFMEDMGKRGKDICGVVIPYTHIARFSIDYPFIFQGLPTWEAIKSSPEEMKSQLAKPEVRARLERERIEGAGNPSFPEWGGWGSIVFDDVENPLLKPIEGNNVEAVARLQECSPVDAFFDTWLQDNLRTQFIYYGWANADQDGLAQIIKSPYGLIGTDAGAHLDRFFWYGSPARLLGYWSREKNLLSLEQAVYKLTGQPAEKLGLNRGRLQGGAPADITVFDPDRIDDLVTERLPAIVDRNEVNRHPPGIEAVVVNGQTVVQAGACLDTYPGKVTRQELCL
jgi:N-acyl-D-aspartate/D-glutamate deacylase